MAAESAHLRACEVALTALYLRGGPHREHVEKRRWVALCSAIRRRDAVIETLANCARQEGFAHEALVLESLPRLYWAENLVDAGRVMTAAHANYPSSWLKVLSSAAPPALWRLGETPNANMQSPRMTRAERAQVRAAPEGQEEHSRGCNPQISEPPAQQPQTGRDETNPRSHDRATLSSALAIVGSRQVSQSVRKFASEVGELAACSGMATISGNAVGCDLAAMRGAASKGGRVVGILPQGIQRSFRRFAGVEYWSVCAPEEDFSRATAMERNALIYASAPFAVVVHANLREGGTWHGAIEAHRRKLTRLIVRDDPNSPGNRALIALGAIALATPVDLFAVMDRAGPQAHLFE